jgi:hypothetical protein
VGEDLEVWTGFFRDGGGGGGIALRSSSCFVAPPSLGLLELSFNCATPSPLPVASFLSAVRASESSTVGTSRSGVLGANIKEGRRSHCVMSHDDGGHR